MTKTQTSPAPQIAIDATLAKLREAGDTQPFAKSHSLPTQRRILAERCRDLGIEPITH